jgi:hypothetical protein
MDSDEPFLLKGLAIGNQVLPRMGRYFTVFAAAAVGVVSTVSVFLFGCNGVLTFAVYPGVYICLTAYGAWAVKKFIGNK